jgi:hypothetical protein
MKKIILAVSMLAASGLVFAAQPGSVQATVGGVNIQGNTRINASAEGTTAIASGNSVARNSVGAIKGGTNIMGNTDISAHARDTTAVAKGQSTAENAIGVIGGQ